MNAKEFLEDLMNKGLRELIRVDAEEDRPVKCTKPNCSCVEIAEKINGGPVKNCPCRATGLSEEMSKTKNNMVNHSKKWIEPRQNIG